MPPEEKPIDFDGDGEGEEDDRDSAVARMIQDAEACANSLHLGEDLDVPPKLLKQMKAIIDKVEKQLKIYRRADRALQRLRLEQQDLWETIRELNPKCKDVPVIEYDPDEGKVKVGMTEEAVMEVIARALPHEAMDMALKHGFPPGPIGRALRLAANRCKCDDCRRRRGESDDR